MHGAESSRKCERPRESFRLWKVKIRNKDLRRSIRGAGGKKRSERAFMTLALSLVAPAGPGARPAPRRNEKRKQKNTELGRAAGEADKNNLRITISQPEFTPVNYIIFQQLNSPAGSALTKT